MTLLKVTGPCLFRKVSSSFMLWPRGLAGLAGLGSAIGSHHSSWCLATTLGSHVDDEAMTNVWNQDSGISMVSIDEVLQMPPLYNI